MSVNEPAAPAKVKVFELLPSRVRFWAYVVVATAISLELVWDLVPSALEGKVLGTFAALGLYVASAHVEK